jgi:uncharacterized phiE125 gp8 family phage protein
MVHELTTQPVWAEVLTTDALREHLRVDHTEENTLIEAYRAAALQYIQATTGVVLGDVAGTIYVDHWQPLWLPIGPITAITSVTYTTGEDTTETLPTTQWWADIVGQRARVRFDNPPALYDYALNRVQIHVNVGYPEAEAPAPLVQAARLLVAHFYENRQNGDVRQLAEIPMGVTYMLAPYRIIV